MEYLFPTALQHSCVQAPLAIGARGSGGLSSQGRNPQATKPCVGLGPLTLGGDAPQLSGSSRLCVPTQRRESRLHHSSTPLTCLV